MTVKAESISLGVIGFDDHRGMKAYINGKPVYCIQRGYPFRSSVSELQMVYIEGSASRGDYAGTIAGCMRYLLYNVEDAQLQLFRGWGGWTINGDHTDATQSSTAGAPTSNAWQEAFDEDKDDDEDTPYANRYGGGSVRKFYLEVVLANLLTGHEGCIDVYPTTMKQISYAEAGFSLPQVYAQAITNYYCWEDPDAAGYSEEAKYQAKQALDWGIEFGFVTTIGGSGYSLRLIYQDSTGVYGISGSSSYSGSCDGYIKTTIGGQYEALKLYRQVVWKTTNMRQIPSFAKSKPGECEPIKLYWDEEQHLYTATVSDHNGVLDYFEFSIPGCTVTNNGDGTLTILLKMSARNSVTSFRRTTKRQIAHLPHNKETLGNPDTYTILQPSTDFDFLDDNCSYYGIEFRIVRIRLDNGTYVCIATNLPEEDFPLEEIKKFYRMRWHEETSFRELKYTIGLINWHSSKYDGILQEISARMILYNFCELVTAHAVVKTGKNTKHVYKINFATAVNICRAYLKHGGDEPETMLLIQRHLTPVRYNRKYPIKLRPKRNRDFMYRTA